MKIKSILESIYGLITNNTDKLSFVIISASVTFFMIGAYLLSYTTYTTITKTKNGWFSDEEESKTIPIHPHEDTGTAVIIFSIVILFLGIGAYFFVDNKSPQITTINSTNELISNSNISVEENKKSLNLTVDNSNNTDTYIQTKNKILKVPTHWYSGLFKGFIVGIFPPLEIYYRYYYSNNIKKYYYYIINNPNKIISDFQKEIKEIKKSIINKKESKDQNNLKLENNNIYIKEKTKINSDSKNISQEYNKFKKLDKEFNQYWKNLNKNLDSKSKDKLLKEQLQWIKIKDSKCNLKNNEKYPPQKIEKLLCLQQETIKRFDILKKYAKYGYN